MPRRLAPLLVVVLALVACAWFVLGIRQSHDLNVAEAIISRPRVLTPAQAARAAALLHQATQLNPDAAVDLARSQLALKQGEAARARAIALGVTRSEPENIQAWLAFGSAAAHDPRAFALALRHLNQLAPPVGSHVH